MIFGATGGVMEAAIRTVVELVTGQKIEKLFDHADVIPVRGFEGVRYAELPISQVGPVPELVAHLFDNWDWLQGVTLKVGVCHGTANAKKVMEDIKAGGRFSQCHFIEFMACPGGCLGGGGQPIPTSPAIRAARAKAIYAEDRVLRRPQVAREPGPVAALRAFSHRRPLRTDQSPPPAHDLHAARQVYRVSGRRVVSCQLQWRGGMASRG